MKKTRSELDNEVGELAALIERRATEEPDNPHLIDEFAGVADGILDAASEDDYEHVWSKLQCNLRDNGLIPGDDEPCDEA